MKFRGLFFFALLLATSIFVLTSPSSAQSFTNLHSFTATTGFFATNLDGASPYAGVVVSGNVLYGTASAGGLYGNGSIFSIHADGTGFSNIYNFSLLDADTSTNTDGAYPEAALVISGGTLYGTASQGGDWGFGSVFKINMDGSGFTNLYSFSGDDDGAYPYGSLVISGNTLYGTASGGGTWGSGTLFSIELDGTGFSNLYEFTALDPSSSTNTDGAAPSAGLLLAGNFLYGTSAQGGYFGNGVVFKINTDGSSYSNLHNFSALSSGNTNWDGAYPVAAVVLSSNILIGTALEGGSAGLGTLFELQTNGSGFAVLHSFTGGADGASPYASVCLSAQTACGVASAGGYSGSGTVFAFDTSANNFNILYSFSATDPDSATNADGAQPNGALAMAAGTLYGTATFGGNSGYGDIFSVSSTVVLSTNQIFGTVIDGNANPVSEVNVYATGNPGQVFTATTDGSGAYSVNVPDGNWQVSVDCNELAQSGYPCANPTNLFICCGQSEEADFIVCGQPLQIMTSNLPPGQVGARYNYFLQAVDCNSTLNWYVGQGALPAGMQLQSSGELSGTPSEGGEFSFTAEVFDGLSNQISESFSMLVVPQSAGTTLTSPIISGGKFQFFLNGEPGQTFTVQMSSNLVDWATIVVTNLGSGSLLTQFPPGTNGHAFYRAFQSGLALTNTGSGNGGPVPVISFSAPSVQANVTNGMAQVTLLRSGSLSNSVCVAYATSDGTAIGGLDYMPVSGTLCFAPFQSNNSFTIPLILNPNTTTAKKNIGIHLFPPNGSNVLDASVAIVYPSFISFETNLFYANGIDGLTQIAVTRFGDLSTGASAYFSTMDGTARAGIDYVSTNGYVNFAPGQQTSSFTVAMLQDANSSSNLTVNMTLTPSENGSTIISPSNSVLLVNQGSVFQFSSAQYSTNFSASNMVFTVTRRGKSSGTASVDFTTLDDGSCIPGYGSSDFGDHPPSPVGDYFSTNGTLIFPPGVTNETFSVTLFSLAADLADGFDVALSNPGFNAGLGAPSLATFVLQRPAPIPVITATYNGTTMIVPDGGFSPPTIITISNAGPPGSILPYSVSPTYAGESQFLILSEAGGTFSPNQNFAQCSQTNGYVFAGGAAYEACNVNLAYVESLPGEEQFDLGDLYLPVSVNGSQAGSVNAVNVAHTLAGEWHGQWFVNVPKFTNGTPSPYCLGIPFGGTWALQFNSLNWTNQIGVGSASAGFSMVGNYYIGGTNTNCPYEPATLSFQLPVTVSYGLVYRSNGYDGTVYAYTTSSNNYVYVDYSTNPLVVGCDLSLNVLNLQVETSQPNSSSIFADYTLTINGTNVAIPDDGWTFPVNGSK